MTFSFVSAPVFTFLLSFPFFSSLIVTPTQSWTVVSTIVPTVLLSRHWFTFYGPIVSYFQIGGVPRAMFWSSPALRLHGHRENPRPNSRRQVSRRMQVGLDEKVCECLAAVVLLQCFLSHFDMFVECVLYVVGDINLFRVVISQS